MKSCVKTLLLKETEKVLVVVFEHIAQFLDVRTQLAVLAGCRKLWESGLRTRTMLHAQVSVPPKARANIDDVRARLLALAPLMRQLHAPALSIISLPGLDLNSVWPLVSLSLGGTTTSAAFLFDLPVVLAHPLFSSIVTLSLKYSENVTSPALRSLSLLHNLRHLDCSHTSLAFLDSSISELVNLISLDISITRISDISEITKLLQLTFLGMEMIPVGDLSPLKYLPKLQHLNLNFCTAESYSFLTELHELKVLKLENSWMNDMNAQSISNLFQLETLHLINSHVSDLIHISKLKNIQDFSVAASVSIENSNVLASFSSTLRILNLSYAQITSFEFLKSMTHLTVLNLTFTRVSKLLLPDLPLLNEFYASGTLINNAELKKLVKHAPNLVILDIASTIISDIAPLADLKKLKTVVLALCSELENIDSLSKLVHLTFLDISMTKVSDLYVITNLINLERLNIKNTPIKSIHSLFALKKLKLLAVGSLSRDLGFAKLNDSLPNLHIYQHALKLMFTIKKFKTQHNNVNKVIIIIEGSTVKEVKSHVWAARSDVISKTVLLDEINN
ncbi:hypothetical protein HK100_008613 [Physocladia obscura]|uniref:Disease resistance R13L4/SHOC-2-like LRR domain-containing protein n=1 Tax=Physocladia obscura TaxID=109957 RepID=A0AAD5T6F5_9FUNG|nr:hypothetical protein HK100_008613 [Physocladia obscura]